MPRNKLIVMQIIDNLDIGGAQEVVHTLVKYLAVGNCRPIVCTLKDGPLRHDIERLGIKVEVLPGRRYGITKFPLFVLDLIRIGRSLAALVRQYEVDVVQTHLLRLLDFIVLFLPFVTRLRLVLWTFHNAKFELTPANLPSHRWLFPIKLYGFRLLYRLAAALVGGFVAVSDEVKNSMVEVIGPIQAKVHVICNGVDTSRYEQEVDRALIRQHLGLAAEARLIIVLATLKEQKGHRYLIEAMAALTPKYPDLHVILVGDGPLRQTLQAQVAELNLEPYVHFLGSRHDVPDLLAASDLFVLPSLWEGLAMALLEGMATGLPIVASEVSGTIQVIVPGESGLLVPPGEVGCLVEAIGGLLSNPTMARQLGAAAKQRVQAEFSAQKQAHEHLKLYHRLCSSG
ncbi:MAG: hypothetical protein DPW09_16525 [Anaerolineae bacterium]|nr:hypothetical protein [Anaerolineae bacterium]